jgi:hypothetical protein
MTLTPWQRANILGALTHLKALARVGEDTKAETLSRGLMEVLEPSRRTVRLQREAAQAATASAQAGSERRAGRDRRLTSDRRKMQEAFSGPDRRAGRDRRATHRRGTAY